MWCLFQLHMQKVLVVSLGRTIFICSTDQQNMTWSWLLLHLSQSKHTSAQNEQSITEKTGKLTSLFGLSSIETSAGMPFRRRTSDLTWETKIKVQWFTNKADYETSTRSLPASRVPSWALHGETTSPAPPLLLFKGWASFFLTNWQT